MMKALLSTCFLLALLSSVTSLQCSRCISKRSSCKGDSNVTCTSKETCVSGAMRQNIAMARKIPSDLTYRGCVPSHTCHSGDYSFTSEDDTFLQMKIFCCGTKECNKEPLHIPPREDLSPNGLQCPACFNLTGADDPTCQGKGTVSCLGNETKCIDFLGHVIYGFYMSTLKFQGCATEDFCALEGKNLKYEIFRLNVYKAQCLDPEISSKQNELEG